MIWRLRGRSEFLQLHRSGRRYAGPVMNLTFAPDVSVVPPRVGYAVGRRVGPAVTRNRVRRRLRAAARACDERRPLPAGRYLIAARSAITELDYNELEAELETTLAQVDG